MAKSDLDRNLFKTFNEKKTKETPIQTIVETKEAVSADTEDNIGFFARIPASLKKKIKTLSVEKDMKQDKLVVEIFEAFFEKEGR